MNDLDFDKEIDLEKGDYWREEDPAPFFTGHGKITLYWCAFYFVVSLVVPTVARAAIEALWP